MIGRIKIFFLAFSLGLFAVSCALQEHLEETFGSEPEPKPVEATPYLREFTALIGVQKRAAPGEVLWARSGHREWDGARVIAPCVVQFFRGEHSAGIATLQVCDFRLDETIGSIQRYVPLGMNAILSLDPDADRALGRLKSLSLMRDLESGGLHLEVDNSRGGVRRVSSAEFGEGIEENVSFERVIEPFSTVDAEYLEFRGAYGGQIHFDYFRPERNGSKRSFVFDIHEGVTPVQILGLRFDVTQVDNTGMDYFWHSIESN